MEMKNKIMMEEAHEVTWLNELSIPLKEQQQNSSIVIVVYFN